MPGRPAAARPPAGVLSLLALLCVLPGAARAMQKGPTPHDTAQWFQGQVERRDRCVQHLKELDDARALQLVYDVHDLMIRGTWTKRDVIGGWWFLKGTKLESARDFKLDKTLGRAEFVLDRALHPLLPALTGPSGDGGSTKVSGGGGSLVKGSSEREIQRMFQESEILLEDDEDKAEGIKKPKEKESKAEVFEEPAVGQVEAAIHEVEELYPLRTAEEIGRLVTSQKLLPVSCFSVDSEMALISERFEQNNKLNEFTGHLQEIVLKFAGAAAVTGARVGVTAHAGPLAGGMAGAAAGLVTSTFISGAMASKRSSDAVKQFRRALRDNLVSALRTRFQHWKPDGPKAKVGLLSGLSAGAAREFDDCTYEAYDSLRTIKLMGSRLALDIYSHKKDNRASPLIDDCLAEPPDENQGGKDEEPKVVMKMVHSLTRAVRRFAVRGSVIGKLQRTYPAVRYLPLLRMMASYYGYNLSEPLMVSMAGATASTVGAWKEVLDKAVDGGVNVYETSEKNLESEKNGKSASEKEKRAIEQQVALKNQLDRIEKLLSK